MQVIFEVRIVKKLFDEKLIIILSVQHTLDFI